MAPELEWFTYPVELLTKAVQLKQILGNVPTIKETLYFDESWHSQVLLLEQGLEWGDTVTKGN